MLEFDYLSLFPDIEESDVEEQPNLLSDSAKSALVGSTVELDCRSNLNPPVAYAWSRPKSNKGIPMGKTRNTLYLDMNLEIIGCNLYDFPYYRSHN